MCAYASPILGVNGGNRTHIQSFRDSCSTVKLQRHVLLVTTEMILAKHYL